MNTTDITTTINAIRSIISPDLFDRVQSLANEIRKELDRAPLAPEPVKPVSVLFAEEEAKVAPPPTPEAPVASPAKPRKVGYALIKLALSMIESSKASDPFNALARASLQMDRELGIDTLSVYTKIRGALPENATAEDLRKQLRKVR